MNWTRRWDLQDAQFEAFIRDISVISLDNYQLIPPREPGHGDRSITSRSRYPERNCIKVSCYFLFSSPFVLSLASRHPVKYVLAENCAGGWNVKCQNVLNVHSPQNGADKISWELWERCEARLRLFWEEKKKYLFSKEDKNVMETLDLQKIPETASR